MADNKKPTVYGEERVVEAEGGYREKPDPNEAELVMLYGPSGAGKTFAQLRAAPNFLWITAPGGTKPYRKALGGFAPCSLEVDSWGIEEVTEIIEQLAGKTNKATGKKFDGIAIDDGTLISDVTHQRKRNNHKTDYAYWDDLKAVFITFRQRARSCGLHVFGNWHEKGPEEKNGQLIRGGPKMPMKDLTESIPAMFDLVARCGVEDASFGAEATGFWPGTFIVDRNETRWVTKDRDGIALPKGPMNLGQLLRVAGYKLALPPGLEFFEEIIPKVADAIVKEPEAAQALSQDVADYTIKELKGKATFSDERIYTCVDWILSDIRDRATILSYHANRLEKFGVKVAI